MNVKWIDITSNIKLYATHAPMVCAVAKHHGAFDSGFDIAAAFKRESIATTENQDKKDNNQTTKTDQKPNKKEQIPNKKEQIPNKKEQIPNKKEQIPNTNLVN